MIAGRLVAASLFCIALAAATAMAYPIYATPQFWVATSVTMLTGILIAAAAFMRRWSPLAQLGVTFGALLVLAIPLAVPSTLRSSGDPFDVMVTVYSAVWASWRRLTTIDLPVGTDDGLLMAPILLVLASTVLGIGMILRTRRGELAMAIPLATLVWALLWGPPAPAPLALTLLFALTIVAGVATLRQARRRRRSDRSVSTLPTRFLSGAIVTGLALGAGAAAAAVMPLDDRVVLRESPPVPREALEAASPLAQFRSSFGDPMRERVLMTVTGVEEGDLVRLASLDVYTGEVFAADTSRLVRTSGRATADDDARAVGFTIQGYSGYWLPSIGQPQSVAFVGDRSAELSQSLMAADTAIGTLALAGLRDGDGYSTFVAPAQQPPEVADLEPAGIAESPTPMPLSGLDWMAARASGDLPAGEALQLLVEAIEAEAYLSHGAQVTEALSRAGHSVARLDALFSAQHMVGDQEQFATATALMARELGFPSRVAVGYRPPGTGTVEIRGGDATAWAEISTTDGWVPIEVVPEQTNPPEAEETANLPEAQPRPPMPPALPEGGQPESQQRGEQGNPSLVIPEPPKATHVAVIVGSVALLLLIALPFLAILLLKRFRRRRRRRGSAREQAAGAWAELIDRFVDRGAESIRDQTRIEYSGGDAAVTEFAHAADRAIFGAQSPSAGDVASLWDRSDALVRAHDARRTRRQRLGFALSLRSIVATLPAYTRQRQHRAAQESSLHSAEG